MWLSSSTWQRCLLLSRLCLLIPLNGVNGYNYGQYQNGQDADYSQYGYGESNQIQFFYDAGASCKGYGIYLQEVTTNCEENLCTFGDEVTFSGKFYTESRFSSNAIWTVETKVCKYAYDGKCVQMGGAGQVDVTEYLGGNYPYAGNYTFSASSDFRGTDLSESDGTGYWSDKYGGYWDNRYDSWYNYYQAKTQNAQDEDEDDDDDDDQVQRNYNSNLNKYRYQDYSKYQNGDADYQYSAYQQYQQQQAEDEEVYGYQKDYGFGGLEAFVVNSTRVIARFKFIPGDDSYAYSTITCDVPLRVVGPNFNMETYMKSSYYKYRHGTTAVSIVALLGLSMYGIRKRKLVACGKPEDGNDEDGMGEEPTNFVLATMGKSKTGETGPVGVSA